MTPNVSKIALITARTIDWLDSVPESYAIEKIVYSDQNMAFLLNEQYHILMVDDQTEQFEVKDIIAAVKRGQPLMSTIVLTDNNNPDYALDLVELGADDVLDVNDKDSYLMRRLELVVHNNNAKRITTRQNRNLNSVTVLSRRLHNAINPETLINDTLHITTKTFNLMGVVIVLQSGGQFHLRAGGYRDNDAKRIYNVIADLHPYDPLYQCIDKEMVMVLEDASINPYLIDLPIFPQLHSAIVVPLQYVNITLGAVMVLGASDNSLTRDDIVIYEHLATHLGSAYQNVRQSYTQDVSAKNSMHLLRTWQKMSQAYTFDQVQEAIQTLAIGIADVKHALVWIYNDINQEPHVSASNNASIRTFNQLFKMGIINDYIDQFDTQLRPLVIWLGRANTMNIGELFQTMEGQQLVMVPIKDETSLRGCILVSSKSNEELSSENIGLLEGIAHAAGQTLERNMLIILKERQNQRLEAITRSIKDGLFFVTEWQEIVFCNPQFTELTGISPSKILYKPIQAFIDELVNQAENPEQVRLELENTIGQLRTSVSNEEYPIIELYIPSIDSRFFMEFLLTSTSDTSDPEGWIGVLRSGGETQPTSVKVVDNVLMSALDYLQQSSVDIHSWLLSTDDNQLSKQSNRLLEQIKSQNADTEQLLINIHRVLKLHQGAPFEKTWNDPNNLVSVILSKPPLRQYGERLQVETKLKDAKIYVHRQSMMSSLTNLVEVGLFLSPNDASVQIQMGEPANHFMFRVIGEKIQCQPKQLNQAIMSPSESVKDIPYAVQLRLYFINQIVTHHGGKLLIKSVPRGGIQLNIFIPPSEGSSDVDSIFEEPVETVPDRKLSTIMIYDSSDSADDVYFDFLETYDYELIYCTKLQQVYDEIDMVKIDVIILTVRQEYEKFLTFVKRLRDQKNVALPILVLSTYNSEEIRIKSLKSGIDAYISLPISNAELLAQVQNLFERSKLPERVQEPMNIHKLHINFAQRYVMLDGKSVNLTRIEYEILRHLALNIDQAVTHTELLSEVWGPEYKNEKDYLWVNMSRLRPKLEKDGTRYIHTVPRVGYILKHPEIEPTI